jgi:hypothetical protein
MSELNYEQLKKEMYKLREQMEKQAKDFFSTASALLFEKYPKLESFAWNQYTPYFNDGETCEFSANTDYIGINGEEGYECYKKCYETTWDNKSNPHYDAEFKAMYEEIQKLLRTFTDDDLETMFGDHVEVTVSRTGVETRECDHD